MRTKEEVAKRNAKWYSENREYVLAYSRKYYVEHREKERARHLEYYAEHRDQRLSHYAEHRDELCIEQANRRARMRAEIFAHYGNQCACCGETEETFLSIDHINGGGNRHRKEIGEGNSLYRWLIKNEFPEGFQLLCHNCNQGKSLRGNCPHNNKPITFDATGWHVTLPSIPRGVNQ